MSDMGHCYGNDLRRRVVEAVTGGLSARGAAARFRVAPATASHWRRRWRETGSIEPDRQGQPPGSKLDAHEAFILALVAQTIPHGHWKTSALTAGLRLSGLAAPMLLDGPMHGVGTGRRGASSRCCSARVSARSDTA